MSEDDRPYGLGLSTSAVEKRRRQLESWNNSDTNLEPGQAVYRSSSKVKFSKGVMLFAAVSHGDEKEVQRLLTEEHADINCTNSDGLTSVHQCCIDDDIEMLKLLIRYGANVNATDNEGWTPLHAAASCGFDHIVSYLLSVGAFPASVNNEGQTPSELGEDFPEIVKMIETDIQNQGIDVDEMRCEEERVMLEDAKKMVNSPHMEPVISSGGATPLHVAAAKNYTTVVSVLLSIVGQDIDARDDDGWTPLHAAVYWESVESAELLVLSGANMYAKTDAGEGYDDLIDPECEDEFMNLKKLNTMVNPEQEPRKRIRHQLSRQRSLTNTNSQNSMDSKGGPLTSPGVKRRLSKEKVITSKLLDMKKEKEDMMLSFEKVDEEPGESVSTSGVCSPPLPYQSLPMDDISSNHVTDQDDALTELQHGRTSSIADGSSPKNGRRKGEMSRKMLERLNMFEINGSSGGSGSGSSSPLPLSPHTSTPVGSPSSEIDDRKRADTSDGTSPRTRVTSLDNKIITTPPLKRFSFQPKPISGASKTQSLDRGESSFFKRAFDKMTSNDHSSTKKDKATERTKSDGQLKQSTPKEPGKKEPVKKEPGKTKLEIVEKVKAPEQTKPVDPPVKQVVSQASATPSSSTAPSSPPSASTPKGELSTDSNSSILSSKDRSASIQPEARRKSTARKQRESRRSTQPVPTDLLQRIKQSDLAEEKEFEESTEINTKPKTDTTQSSEEVKIQVTRSEEFAKDQETNIQKTQEDKKESGGGGGGGEKGGKGGLPIPIQSAYKPYNRPVSKLLSDEEEGCRLVISEVLSSTPSMSEQNSMNSSNLSPSVPRSRANTRRKNKRDKRRSTGIGEPEENEEIPENLKNIFGHPRQGSSDSADSTGQNTILTDAVQGIHDTSLSTAAVEYYQQEIDKLKLLLREEKGKSMEILKDCKNSNEQIKQRDAQIIELQRKYQDTNRAYQQEKLERENKDRRIQQLEKSDKTIAELKSEIQRLKDENGALIRVVGKLSRAPFTS